MAHKRRGHSHWSEEGAAVTDHKIVNRKSVWTHGKREKAEPTLKESEPKNRILSH